MTAGIQHTVGNPPPVNTALTFSFEYYSGAATAPEPETVIVARLFVADPFGTGGYSISLALQGTNAFFAEEAVGTDAGPASPTPVPAPPVTKWTRIGFTVVNFGTANEQVKLLYDGVKQGTLVPMNHFAGKVQPFLGVYANSTGASHDLWFDDVTVTSN